jgi:hypothetical protein
MIIHLVWRPPADTEQPFLQNIVGPWDNICILPATQATSVFN